MQNRFYCIEAGYPVTQNQSRIPEPIRLQVLIWAAKVPSKCAPFPFDGALVGERLLNAGRTNQFLTEGEVVAKRKRTTQVRFLRPATSHLLVSNRMHLMEWNL